MSETAQVAEIRRFNRAITARVGALNDRFLGRGRPLGEARLLWEIGPDGCELRELRRRLDLDSGYLSRLLRALEAEGLVTVAANDADRRSRVATLTSAGRAERAVLDERSDALARSVLDPLSGTQRDRLVGAMRDVERLLDAAAVEIAPADPEYPDARRCLQAYFVELDRRSDTGFDPAAGISAEPHELRRPAGLLLLARLHGEAVGCGVVKHHDGAPSEIKRMWVAEPARGLGIARRLLAELEADAAAAGAERVRLETNRHLTEAIAMYRAAGYAEVPAFNDEPFADHWFEKRLRSASGSPGSRRPGSGRASAS
jgi:DNA-binding MarR family transcriptional regulator/ribosomal protein S18 acetylase RimI-like enzyme